MKRILVPSDLSDMAEEGLKMAVKLATRLKAEIYLVNFFEPPSATATFFNNGRLSAKSGTMDVAYQIEMVRKNRSKLALLASHYTQQGVTIKYDILNERLKDGIASYIKENKIDLVVMGTDAENAKEQQLIEGHAGQVQETIPCPVITVSTIYGIDI